MVSLAHAYLHVGKWKTFNLNAAFHSGFTSFLRHLANLSFAYCQPGMQRPLMLCCSRAQELTPDLDVQITLTPPHPLKRAGIRKWIKCLEDQNAARIIFCDPACLYSKFKKQDAQRLAEKNMFEQYVVHFDVDVHEKA